MNKIILQLWEESVRGAEPILSGCSLHIDTAEKKRYIEAIRSLRKGNSAPEEYDSPFGGAIVAFVEDSLFELVARDKTVRITQYQLNNLKSMEEITFKEEI